MLASPAAAQDNAASFQFGHFEEGNRNLYGVTSKFKPIESDSLQSSAWFDVTDSLKGLVNFRQDTWSGATPIATAPREWRGNRSRAPDGVSGASPYLVSNSNLFLDAKTLQPLKTDGFGNLTGGVDNQLVHTLSGASRETRKQVDFNFRREWEDMSVDVGGGTSIENDYVSRFAAIGGRWDFNQKLTTLNLGLSYTGDSTNATLDHDATPYIYNACGNATCNFVSSTSHIDDLGAGKKVLRGDRDDWAGVVGLTQILNRNAQVNTNLGYTRSHGYLSSPYRVVEVAFIDPNQQFLSPSPNALYINTNSMLDKRPDKRNQWLWNLRYAQYIDATNAGLHLNYAYFRDDWGIQAHTLEVEWAQPFDNGWLVTPMVRYYTQTAASFYTPYLVTNQAQRTDQNGPFDASKLPTYYSSDYRLSGYGALGAGLTVSKQFSKGVTLNVGYEYYRHAGNLKLGGGGEGSYSDFSSYLVNASLTFAFDADGKASLGAEGHEGHTGHDAPGDAHTHSGALAPAGIMFGHVLPNAGDFMAGYRYMNSRQAGTMLHGASKVDLAQVKADGCDGGRCLISPTVMNMNMNMLELMYAPTDWLTLMLMPQYVDMNMSMQGLLGAAEEAALPPDTRALYDHHTLHDHTSGGIGDTGIYALFKLFEQPGRELHAALGITAPTGAVDVKLRDTHQVDAGFDHYGMQLGSGTWDLNPSITYTQVANGWFWGGQLIATLRLQDHNRSGYALGNMVQSSVWAGTQFADGWSASLRGVYTQQAAIRGQFNDTFRQLATVDYPSNYGGRYWDLGVGTNYRLGGSFAGNQLGVEWLQPLRDDVNGYQLKRKGALYATWQYMF